MRHIFSLSSKEKIDLLFLSLFIILINFIFLGSAPLFPPDEGRYAEIAREMLSSHQWILPHLDGLLYFEKPPLSYWINAFCISLFGYSEWTIRAPVAIFGVLCCLTTYFVGAKLFNRRIGFLSALILSSSFLHLGMSHIVTTDMPLTFFLTSSLFCFLLAFQTPIRSEQRAFFWIAYALAGLAMLTKGLIGIVFPAMIICIWIISTKQWRLLKKMCFINGICIIMLINLPWIIFVQKQVPDFFYFYFIEQQIARYATPIANREMAFSIYCLVFIFGLLPWVFWLPAGLKLIYLNIKKRVSSYQINLYLIIWPSFIFIFFACSHSILIPYILPLFAPISIIIAQYMDYYWDEFLHKTQRINVSIFSGFFFTLGFILILLPYLDISKEDAQTFSHIRLIAIPSILCAWITYYAARHRAMNFIFKMVLLTSYSCWIMGWFFAVDVNFRTVKDLALTVRTLSQNKIDPIIVSYGAYYQDLPYYLRQLVTIVNFQGELAFGIQHQLEHFSRLIMDEKSFEEYWNSKKTLYVVLTANRYPTFCNKEYHRCFLLGKSTQDILISNHDPNMLF